MARLFRALSREQQECQALQAEVLRGARLASAHTLELAALRGRLARRTIQMASLEEEVRDERPSASDGVLSACDEPPSASDGALSDLEERDCH